jgi:hypothetical protein
MCPQYFPDLQMYDSYLWVMLKDRVYNAHCTEDDLEENFQDALSSVSLA